MFMMLTLPHWPWRRRISKDRVAFGARLQESFRDAIRWQRERDEEDDKEQRLQHTRDVMYEQTEARRQRLAEALATWEQGLLTRERHPHR